MTDEERQSLTTYLTWEVKGGFTTEEELIDDDLEEILEMELEEVTPDDLNEAADMVRRLFAEQRAEEATWTESTTNDAIDAAFAELNERGIIALQNAGFTVTDGWADVHEAAAEFDGEPRGATFYHEQGRDRGIEGEGLMLVFGAFDDNESKHRAIAEEIVKILKKHGVHAHWDGDVNQRIEIAPFEWRKRQGRSVTDNPLWNHQKEAS